MRYTFSDYQKAADAAKERFSQLICDCVENM